MARKNGARAGARKQRRLNRLQEKAVGAFLLGLAFVVGPAFIGNPVLQNALGALRTVGWLVMLFGAALMGLHHFMRRAAAPVHRPASPATDPVIAGSSPTRTPSAIPPRLTDVAASPLSAAAPVGEGADAPALQRPTVWSSAVFDVIEWRRFEAVCERLFAQAGFETRSQSHGADEGIDIWLYSKTQPDAAVSLVQCKCWSTRAVGVQEVRALLGSMAAKKVKRGVFATSSRFSTDAAQFGKDNGIHLLDRTGLLDLIGKRTPEQQQELLRVATEGEFWIPTCASCGVKMVRRRPRRGGNAFWGCANYPGCRNVING